MADIVSPRYESMPSAATLFLGRSKTPWPGRDWSGCRGSMQMAEREIAGVASHLAGTGCVNDVGQITCLLTRLTLNGLQQVFQTILRGIGHMPSECIRIKYRRGHYVCDKRGSQTHHASKSVKPRTGWRGQGAEALRHASTLQRVTPSGDFRTISRYGATKNTRYDKQCYVLMTWIKTGAR